MLDSYCLQRDDASAISSICHESIFVRIHKKFRRTGRVVRYKGAEQSVVLLHHIHFGNHRNKERLHMTHHSGLLLRRPRLSRFSTFTAAATLVAACSGAPSEDDSHVATNRQLLTEDGLADAFATFKQVFTNQGFDQRFPIGYAFHPGLVTEKLVTSGRTPAGSAALVFGEGRVTASLNDVPSGANFDLWFVKNIAGSGRTVKPESGDTFVKVGTFGVTSPTTRSLNVVVGGNVNFDLDMVVVTRQGQHPTASRIAVGSRTLFEKRFFRERAGRTLDPVSGTIANDIETTDPLVGRGAELFFNEQFAGNGRTCGTCHRADRSLTIDAAFIATLPQSDALFVAETNPALAGLENPTLMRQRGLILENVDGLEDPTHKFVMRGVPHTLALNTTNDVTVAGFGPPDQRIGWGGDGAPGRATMNEFAFGAVIQHFTKTLSRRPGIDFRIPTQEELDALEAFQLFTGRQKFLRGNNLQFRDARAAQGKDLFNGQGQCTACHSDFFQTPSNSSFNTGVATLTPDLPNDDGFLQSGLFNVPPLIEAADTPPLFHNNAAADIEAAVGFYVSQNFRNSPEGFFDINLDLTQQANIAAFLRVLNAAENVRQVRKRVSFVRNNRSSGNTDLLTVAIADTQDALTVLSAKGLNPTSQNELADVKQTLIIAKANADQDRPAFMDHALVYLDLVKADLFSANPDNEF